MHNKNLHKFLFVKIKRMVKDAFLSKDGDRLASMIVLSLICGKVEGC